MSNEPANRSDGDEPTADADPSTLDPASAVGTQPSGNARASSDGTAHTPPPRPLNEVTARTSSGGPDASAQSTGRRPAGGRPADDRAADDEFEEVAGRVADGDPQVGVDILPDHSFALCLTHDVDRPYKFAQAFYYALRDRDPGQLKALLPGRRPNWTFDRVLSIEAELGVRSAFYFLDEQRLFRDRPVREWFDLDAWQLYADRYSLDDPAIAELIGRLDRGGWEVGLHGSYESYDDRGRLRREKHRLERVLGKPVLGGRQHYLNRTLPDTWNHHAEIGLGYDATVGSASEIGFEYGDTVGRPFGDEFVAFPLTMMDVAMPDPGEQPEAARSAADGILREAAERGAVATVLWHPRVFNETDWAGHADLYRHLIERAQELGGWVGPPRDIYAELDQPE
jgi:peptidoglycan/xylan/chitin deacetylase (PgdA/CDA1 family)